jgi:hypothetical protein
MAFAPIILYRMKKCILLLFACSIMCGRCALAQHTVRDPFVVYVAGIELIAGDKTLGPEERARRYHELCMITGITGEKAKKIVLQYKNDPAGWEKIEISVMELLQKKG